MKSILWFLLCLCGFSVFTGSVNATIVNGNTGQIITLSSGWNTFSTPKILDDISFQSGGTGLFFYSLTSTGWQIVNPNITTIKPLEGYVVNNTNSGTTDITLSYKSNLSPMEMIFQKQLHIGWNILGITTINNPFGTIGSNITMSLDFTRSSEGGLNYANRVAPTYFSRIGSPYINNLLGGEAYGIFMQSPMLYAGVQNQTIGSDYVPSTVAVNLLTDGIIPTGKTNQLFGRILISAGEQDVITNSFTLTSFGSGDFTKRFTNIKIYRNGVSVGIVNMNTNKIIVSDLTDVLNSGNTQTYELRGDILVDATSTDFGIKVDSINDINVMEVATGYNTSIVLGNPSINVTFSNLEFTFTKSSTGNVTIAPGTNNVKLFDGKLASTTPISVRKIKVSSASTGTGITAFVNDNLTVKLNGSEIGTLTALYSTGVELTVSFVVDTTNPAVLTVEGSTKNNTNIAPSSNQFTVALTEVRDSSNNSITSLGAGSSLIGDKVSIINAEVELKTATVAAPSTSRLYSSTEQEIGRFALTAHNEVARLQSITVNNVGSTTIQSIANSTSSAKLVDVATGLEVSSSVTIFANTLTFSSMNDTISKDVTKNYKIVLGVSSIEAHYGETIQLSIPNNNISIVRDSNSNAITPTGSAATKTYTIGTVAPTVLVTAINENTFKVRVTNSDSNTGITLTGAKFDLKTALPGSTTYSATACLRDLGNTNTCGGVGTSGSGAVPALAQTLAVGGLTTNMTADKNGGYIEFEVYITSANLLPTSGQLQVALTQLNYTVGGASDIETYVGTVGASASFTK